VTNPCDNVGKKIGKLTILSVYKEDKLNSCRKFYRCICDCGNYREMRTDQLDTMNQSCGCARVVGPAISRTKEYITWQAIKYRCNISTGRASKVYHNKGIQVCPEWLDSFPKFLEDMGLAPSPDHSIDRINNDEGYSKANCRWATAKQQCRNRRTNVFVEYQGENLCIAEWAERFNLPYSVISFRIKEKWDIHLALTTPILDRVACRRGYVRLHETL
jgi:hypothetical protein